jgi:hypothetical protein
MTSKPSNAALQADLQMERVRELLAAVDVDYDLMFAMQNERFDLASDRDVAYLERQRALKAGNVEGAARATREEGEANDAIAKWDAQFADKLKAMKEAAGESTSAQYALTQIKDEALTVSSKGKQFCILITFGGPQVQISGELDAKKQPLRAWIEYLGWGDPLTTRENQPGDEAMLVRFCRHFRF